VCLKAGKTACRRKTKRGNRGQTGRKGEKSDSKAKQDGNQGFFRKL